MNSSSQRQRERERAIDELVQGRHFAYKLKAFLLQSENNKNNESLPPPQDLVLNVLNSFTNTLSILNPPPSDHLSHFPPASFQLSDARNSDDSADTSRSSSSTKYRRGCYKRRKTWNSWTRESSDLVDDGNGWRKYGQKMILKGKYPRCTHKYEQGCEAKKQVQRIEEEPPLYRTIYNGNHTCKPNHNHVFIDYHEHEHESDKSVLISFDGASSNKSSTSSSDQALNNSSSCITTHNTFQMDHFMLPSDLHHPHFDHDHHVFADCI
ncbi:WRKY DNA-binding transcription factor 70 isoform X2 [Euphorbia lathyris]|uniref:WRKY DNA-binding transcription factor 70 isoform X2 n=1 Tax=Euphorbia lathyris TaxID=212925 RepID=UPI003314098B